VLRGTYIIEFIPVGLDIFQLGRLGLSKTERDLTTEPEEVNSTQLGRQVRKQ
jgi:hypothetical protein